jgi:manganese/zinc/iron transport system substrate-binding protein
MNRILAATLPLLASALLPGCSDAPESKGGPYRVVATVGMIADIVREVAGPLAEVDGIIGEGVDPHVYKPTASDIKAMQSADVVFYNGLLLEGKMTDILVKLATSGKPVHAVTEGLSEESGYVLSGEDEHHDPHVWMDVKGWIAATAVVEKALAAYDAPNAATYQANAAAYRAKLEALDQYAKTSIASIPAPQRVLVTAHDAFQYLARAYGIEVRGIQGMSTESEAVSSSNARSPPSLSKVPSPTRTYGHFSKGPPRKATPSSSAANSTPMPWVRRAPTKAPTSA